MFRKAAPQDADTLKEIARRVIRHNYVPFLGAEATNAFIDSGMSDQEIDDGLDRCTVMLSDCQIIGFAIAMDDLLHLIMVDVPFQGKGYGGQLLAHTENEMFGHHKTIRLHSFQENVDSVQFYLAKGWHVVGQEAVKELDKTILFFEKTTAECANE